MRHLEQKILSIILLTVILISSMCADAIEIYAADSKIESAISWAVSIANDNSHGYSQTSRYGPDYDCSSLVITAMNNAGISTGSATYTGNMISNFEANGFSWIPWSSIGSSSNLQRGDILLNIKYHTAIYMGNNQVVEAHARSAADKAHDSRDVSVAQTLAGDQDGQEIRVTSYYLYSSGWDGVLRYGGTPGPGNFPGEEDTSWNVPVWKTANSYLNTYNSSGIQESGHNIDAGDNCYIEKVYKNGYVHVKYPTPSGDRWAYAKASGFSLDKKNTNFPGEEDTSWNVPVWKTANSYLNTYNDAGTQESNHNIDAGDNCYIEKVYKNGFVHVKYPTPSGDRWAYAKASGFSLEKKSSGSHDPVGVVDVIEGGAGNVHVRGWAFDPDTTNKSLEIHVYVGGLAESSSSEGHGGIMANTERTDVNNVYSCGNNHGFDVTLSTSKRGSQAVYVYTFDTTTDENFVIGSKTITISEPLKTYTISYNANGGTGAPASQTKTQGTDLTLSSTKPTRTGYTFLGWSTSSTATTATYTAGGKYNANAAATLYAVWKANTYTISYNANGGMGAPASQTKTYGIDITLSSAKPTKTGYDFLGWSTSTTATSATYSAGGKYTANASVTLYAVWKALPTAILGDVNDDGDIDFADATLILQADSGKITLTANQKTAADVNKDGDVDFADATLVLQYDSGKISKF